LTRAPLNYTLTVQTKYCTLMYIDGHGGDQYESSYVH
jgi:hypothetical protein